MDVFPPMWLDVWEERRYEKQRIYMVVEWWCEEFNIKKKDAHKAMCGNGTEENMNRYKAMKNESKKAVSKAMRERRVKKCLLKIMKFIFFLLGKLSK